jgi:hypothetical protein
VDGACRGRWTDVESYFMSEGTAELGIIKRISVENSLWSGI